MNKVIAPIISIALILLMVQCEQKIEEPFEYYTIKKGRHTSSNKVELLQSKTMQFTAVFDDTAIYTSGTEENQHDTNKLLGFSDCNDHHHRNSARFGWRWLDEQLEILAYVYADGERIIESLGTVPLNEEIEYQLTMGDHYYHFNLDVFPPVSIERKNKCEVGIYYVLAPYFGGDETAPHDITIKVRKKR